MASNDNGRRRHRGRCLLLPSFALIAGAMVFIAPAADAADAAGPQPSFAVEAVSPAPGLNYFVYEGHPGESYGGQIRITNAGSAPGPLLVYPVDATTGQTSGIVYFDGGDPRLH